MCVPIRALRGVPASRLLRKIGMDENIPIDLEPILQRCNIIARPFDFSCLEEHPDFEKEIQAKGHILGVIISDPDIAGILYKKDEAPDVQRFIIGHELGHCATLTEPLDQFVEFCKDYISGEDKEKYANAFASELLIPEKPLMQMCQLPGISLHVLSKAFAVPAFLMGTRLKNLKLSV